VKSLLNDKAVAYMNVTQNDGSGNDNNSVNSNSSTVNYAGSKVYFCEDVSSTGDAVNPDVLFNINRDGGWVMVLVKNGPGQPLNTNSFIVDVYKKKGSEYKFFETKNVTGVMSTGDYDYFKYTFYDTGDYRFSVYNGNSKWIQDGYVTVKYK
jgi:hypothetical protein